MEFIIKIHKSSKEKNAQQMLVMANNTNPTSKWFCFDIEYEQSIRNQQKNHFVGRTDILAISKKSPHRLAVIELKYNKESIPCLKNDTIYLSYISQPKGLIKV